MSVSAAPSLVDRLATALISAVVMATMAVVVSSGLLIVTRGRAVQVLGVYLSLAGWGSAVVAAAAVAGFSLGSERTTVVFGYLWLTERPRNPMLSVLLWLGLVIIGLVGYYFLPFCHVY